MRIGPLSFNTGHQYQMGPPLLQLPAELRNSIYEHVNLNETVVLRSLAVLVNERYLHYLSPNLRNLKLACRQLFLETHHLPLQLADPSKNLSSNLVRRDFKSKYKMDSVTGLILHFAESRAWFGAVTLQYTLSHKKNMILRCLMTLALGHKRANLLAELGTHIGQDSQDKNSKTVPSTDDIRHLHQFMHNQQPFIHKSNCT
ncbi:hypothetical protein HBH64_160400 [Parastagonospora nodorum]|nr:hypothetical protein HBH53_103870 [Parastagonospora nodorum]KAH4311233.1 hypothetical protein HBI01_018170 [Parastagonospora nodorum]KAH4316825.1 hypothetical protein HBI02_034510 [Parastagonospora nodorum]KAH4326561.1 hypothetical protein HBI00_138420 [Parastagonospora nodorum]KAH4388415.1 hypothetical protein HBH94_034390 [Parastagonospora nodorum]